MKKIEIIPFQSAEKFKLNETRTILLPKIDFKLRNTREEILGNNQFIIDDYEEALAYYNKTNEKLFYVLFAPFPTYELIFQNRNLFALKSGELFDFMSEWDENLLVEDYVGFGSVKFGIDVYAPNFTDDKSSLTEGISFASKGYFDTLYAGNQLDINKIQNESV